MYGKYDPFPIYRCQRVSTMGCLGIFSLDASFHIIYPFIKVVFLENIIRSDDLFDKMHLFIYESFQKVRLRISCEKRVTLCFLWREKLLEMCPKNFLEF